LSLILTWIFTATKAFGFLIETRTRGRCFFVVICFVAGTDVLTPDGPRDIETIQPGEKVWSFDGETGQWQTTEVIATSETLYDGVMVKVEITDDDGSFEAIECTGGHPFWVVGGIALADRTHAEDAMPQGAQPTAGGRWVEAGSLRVGDTLLTRDGGYAVVAGVTSHAEQRVVYNLTLASVHSYAVGDEGVLVHNACPGRMGKQAKLRSLLTDPNTSSRVKGWIRQEINSGRGNIRVQAFNLPIDVGLKRDTDMDTNAAIFKNAGYTGFSTISRVTDDLDAVDDRSTTNARANRSDSI
jgi:hypothetical protein